MKRPLYEYRCGTCRSPDIVINPVAPGSSDHSFCFTLKCSNGHLLVGTGGEMIQIGTMKVDRRGTLEFRTNRPWRRG